MVGILLVGGTIFLVADILVALIALSMQQRSFDRSLMALQREHKVQEERTLELEEKLTSQSQHLQHVWHSWQASVEALAHQQEVAQLPRVEDFPLPPSPRSPIHQQDVLTNWRPARFFRANLSGHDLSRRYLGWADLREAQLAGTNFYLADLSGACLAGANLTEADLSGANLSGADLRNATLTNANLLVADLQGAVLTGANLLGVRNLSRQQLCSSIFDRTTKLNAELLVLRHDTLRIIDGAGPGVEADQARVAEPVQTSETQAEQVSSSNAQQKLPSSVPTEQATQARSRKKAVSQPTASVKCTFSGVVQISLKRFEESGVALVECPDCGRAWTLSPSGGALRFNPHDKRKMNTPNTGRRWARGEGKTDWNVVGG
jgi:hypothetical protein